MTEFAITFYHLAKCGFYKRAEENPSFGTLQDVLAQLHDWVHGNGMTMGATSTYLASDSGGDGLPATYCFDIQHHANGDSLLTIWNASPVYEEQVAAAHEDGAVGDVQVEYQDFPDGTIPGFASYFWFLPPENLYATIRPGGMIAGRGAMEAYVRSFMARFSNFCVYDESDASHQELLGYSDSSPDDHEHHYVRFRGRRVRNRGELDLLLRNRSRIRKTIQKNTLRPHVTADASLLQRLLRGLAGGHHGDPRGELPSDCVHVRYEVEYTPTARELKEMFQYIADFDHTKWDDIGFALEGEQDIHWLSHSYVKQEVELDLETGQDRVHDAEELLGKLVARRRRFLRNGMAVRA